VDCGKQKSDILYIHCRVEERVEAVRRKLDLCLLVAAKSAAELLAHERLEKPRESQADWRSVGNTLHDEVSSF